MHPRVRLVIVGVFACTLAALAGVWIAAARGPGGDAAVTPKQLGELRGYSQPAGAKVPEFHLTDPDGRAVEPTNAWSIYSFVYATCEDTCPLQTQQIRGALDDFGRDLSVYGISVDPANDTPRRAKAFLTKQFMVGRMTYALGTRRELEPVWKAFGINPQTDDIDHKARVVLVNPAGEPVVGWPGEEVTDDALLLELTRLGA